MNDCPTLLPSPDHAASLTLVQGLFIQNVSSIKGFILGLEPDFGGLDDVLQEVFVVVSTKADTFNAEMSFLAWVRGIARMKILERRRTRKHLAPCLSPEALDALCAAAPNDDSAELTADKADALRGCLDKLAPQSRRAIELRYREACRPAEIAERLSWTVGSVSVALSRALSVLRDCVERKIAQKEAG